MRGLKRGRGIGVVWRRLLSRNPPGGGNFVLRGIEPRAYIFRKFAQGALVYESFRPTLNKAGKTWPRVFILKWILSVR